MEDKGAVLTIASNGKGQNNEVAESDRARMDMPAALKQATGSTEDDIQFRMIDPKSEEDDAQKEASKTYDPSAEVNMEATINSDDVLRAGGFGARDDLSSFLPVASDSTDFEASLLDARDYEEPQGEHRRPGLGWSESKE